MSKNPYGITGRSQPYLQTTNKPEKIAKENAPAYFVPLLKIRKKVFRNIDCQSRSIDFSPNFENWKKNFFHLSRSLGLVP